MPLTGRIGILGLGLIGGSLLRRLAAAGLAVTGYDVDGATVTAARAAGYDAGDDPAAIRGVDVVVIATPLPAVDATLGLAAGAAPHAIVTDVVSVKAAVRRLVTASGPAVRFVGGHPMAGTERSGFAAADADLFAGAPWVLCLEDDTEVDAWLTIAELAVLTGAHVVPATADRHDAAVATISHVPHLLAAALTTAAAADPLALSLAAGSFRDATRVMQTRPELVAAMCSGNSGAVHGALADVLRRLHDLDAALDDSGALEAALARAHGVRVAWTGDADVTRRTVDRADRELRSVLLALGESGGWVESVGPDRLTVADRG